MTCGTCRDVRLGAVKIDHEVSPTIYYNVPAGFSRLHGDPPPSGVIDPAVP